MRAASPPRQMERENEMIVISHRLFFTARTLHRMVNNHCRTAGNVFGGQLSSYIERHLLSLSRTTNEEKGIFKNGIHDIIRETLIKSNSAIQSVCP